MFTIKIIYQDNGESESIERFDNIEEYKDALDYYGIKTDETSTTIIW